MDLKNQVIVITGGTKGLGLALAKNFFEKTNQVIVGSRSAQFEAGCKKKGIIAVRIDVKSEVEVKALSEFVYDRFGRIDIWINNAGIWLPHMSINEIDTKRFHELIEVNLFGVFYGSKYALKFMKENKQGMIINVLSSSALKGSAGSAAYCASKFAASGFTQSLREEVRNWNIKVIAVYTRGIKTKFFNENKPQEYDDFMDSGYVAQKIIENIESNVVKDELKIYK